jgi:hypothetical protein
VYKKRIPSYSSPAVGFTISMVIGIKTVLWQKGVIRSVKLNQSCSLDKLHGIDTKTGHGYAHNTKGEANL